MATISRQHFGYTKDGKEIDKFTLKGSKVSICVINFGCAITNIYAPDRNGEVEDIVLGFDDVAGYELNVAYIGAVIGRVAGRISNGKFTLDGKTYNLPVNNGNNSIHGGKLGFGRRVWKAEIKDNKLCLNYASLDGEEGYPGDVTTEVVYRNNIRTLNCLDPDKACDVCRAGYVYGSEFMSKDDILTIDYTARTTKACPINFTNHAYFNLGGQDCDNIQDHVVQIDAKAYVPVEGEDLIPTGELPAVNGQPVDVRKPTRIGDIEDHIKAGSLDITYCVGETGKKKKISRIEHPPTGRYIETETSAPGLQFYTSKFLRDVTGKGNRQYKPFMAFCLEAQDYPNAINHPNFPNTVLRPGETYRQTTSYSFGCS